MKEEGSLHKDIHMKGRISYQLIILAKGTPIHSYLQSNFYSIGSNDDEVNNGAIFLPCFHKLSVFE
jgi:hypothetical protein